MKIMENNGLQPTKDIEQEIAKSFHKNWSTAEKDGWTISNRLVTPPKDHKASVNPWAARYIKIRNDILVPHWFIDYYPI